MDSVVALLKWAVVLVLVGVGAWWLYDMQQKRPLDANGIKGVAQKIAGIVGDTKTELSNTDMPSVEFEANRAAAVSIETLNNGLLMLGSSREEYVAAELLLLRVYSTAPDGYVSCIEGDPWSVSGELVQLSPFEIVRDGPAPPPIADMVKMFNSGGKRRAGAPGVGL